AAAFFSDTPANNHDLVNRAVQSALASSTEQTSQFRSKVENEIRIGLLGSHPYAHPVNGWKPDLQQISSDDVARFFNENYGTDRAFVLTSSALPEDARRSLTAVTRRTS